jgi:hypothetical protein
MSGGRGWRRTVSRGVATLGVLGLLAAAGTVPASAGQASTVTWWVDDDGKVGATGCDGTRPVKKEIQPVVAAADRYDTIKVCPGTYDEIVTILGGNKLALKLISVAKHDAIVTGFHVEDVANVTIQGFGWVMDPTVGCGTDAINVVRATRLSVIGNRFSMMPRLPDAPDPCETLAIGGTGTRLVVQGNVITDAVWAIDFVGQATITGNRITSTGILREIDDPVCLGIAIYLQTPSGKTRSVLKGNIVKGPAERPAEQRPRVWCYGIGAEQKVDVIGNTLSGARVGIITELGGPLIKGNRIDRTKIGIQTDERATIRENVVRTSETGIHADAFYNRIIENDFRGNSGIDCIDNSEPNHGDFPETNGTGNQWVRNLGDEGTPKGICKKSWG